MSRIATWQQFFKKKDFSLLERAVEDKIHTPYRVKHLPLLVAVAELCIKLGATYSLSGSGPSILIYTEKKNAKKFLEKFQIELSKKNSSNIAYTIQKIETDNAGVLIKETK
jgi:homoserine kinase